MLWDHLGICGPLQIKTLLCSTWLYEPYRVNHLTKHPSPIPSYIWVTFACSCQVSPRLSFNKLSGQDSSPSQRMYSACGFLCKKCLPCKACESSFWSFIFLDWLPRNSSILRLSTQQQIFPKRGCTAGCGGGPGSRRAGKNYIKKCLQAEKASLDFLRPQLDCG